jgi:hypothetical protein
MGTVIFDFDHRREAWTERSHGSHALFNKGYQAYCVKQAELWLDLRCKAWQEFSPYLTVSINVGSFIYSITDIFYRSTQ